VQRQRGRHAGLDARADIGRPIANLLREPAFVDYLASPDHAGTPVIRAPIAQGLVLDLRWCPYGEAQKLLLCRDVTHAERVETMRRDSSPTFRTSCARR